MTTSIIQFITGEFYLKIEINNDPYYYTFSIPQYKDTLLFKTAAAAEEFALDFIIPERWRLISPFNKNSVDEWTYKVFEYGNQ